MHTKTDRLRAFTITEVLLVIAILSAVLIPVTQTFTRAMEIKRQSAAIDIAIETNTAKKHWSRKNNSTTVSVPSTSSSFFNTIRQYYNSSLSEFSYDEFTSMLGDYQISFGSTKYDSIVLTLNSTVIAYE